MATTSEHRLVKVATAGPEIDGIVFDTPSQSKVVVAVIDRTKGPVLRTVHPDAVSEREEDGPDDHALALLIKRTPPPVRAGGRAGGNAGRGRAAHTRGASHRPTGR